MRKTPLDTIAAIATPPGRGGVAIVRVSGPAVRQIISSLLDFELIPRKAAYLPFYDADKNIIDQGLALFFSNPHSFTGEDVLELHGHGGPVVTDMLLQEILRKGVRLAGPGEFSERAFLNGKMDLTQAEAVADLIDASSQQAVKSAMKSLQGEFSKQINRFNEQLVNLRIFIEAAIDFSDEEIEFLTDSKQVSQLREIFNTIETIERQAKQGSILREGINLVIVGAPNTGKSTLLNALSGREAAIVSPIPGTTRDVVREHISLDGIPIHLIDTAGLRVTDDIIELEGIRRAQQELKLADIVIYLIEQPSECPLPPERNLLLVRNKIDLCNESAGYREVNGYRLIALSAKTGEGLDLLKQQIKRHIGYDSQMDGVFLARRRHLDALARAKSFIHDSLVKLTETKVLELAAEDLRLAHKSLCEITGEFHADDLLGKIFSTFCIGK